ncbi:MAG: hypothetical protein GQ574_01295 [Crocinitomix sp.]|nr:hypothetical protein [Crocinitomix sp.]
MSISTLILNTGATGSAQVTPTSYPATVVLSYSPQGNATVMYGLNGKTPTTPLNSGQTSVQITSNSLQLSYSVVSQSAKLQWEL